MIPRNLFTGAHVAERRIENAVTAKGAARVLVIGTAGAGKSMVLRTLGERLFAEGRTIRILDARLEIGSVPAKEVLVVDDLHLLSPERIAAIRDRAGDPMAGLIVGMRPWPRTAHVTDIERRLQRSAPPIILGQVSRAEVQEYLESEGRTVEPACITELIQRSGGTAWIITYVLSNPQALSCEGEERQDLWRDVEDQVLQRLDTVDAPLRRTIERLSLGGPGDGRFPESHGEATDELIAQGHSEGLLLRNGSPLPIVRSAVRSAVSVHWKSAHSDVLARGIVNAADGDDASYEELVRGVRDSRLADAIATRADQLLVSDPVRAGNLYRTALETGADPGTMPLRLARAAWAVGDLDGAAEWVNAAHLNYRDGEDTEIADIAAAVWAARGMMATAGEVYGEFDRRDSVEAGRAAIARIGAGHLDSEESGAELPGGNSATSTLGIAMRLLRRGLRASLSPTPDSSAIKDLVRASELYTAARASAPIPELPAVIATQAAIGVGDLPRAGLILESAIAGGQGGEWARRRLLLWQSLVAIQAERPAEARQALAEAEELTTPVSIRDALLTHVVRIMLVRRYEDVAALEGAWATMRESFSYADVDLYMLFPLGMLVSAVARVDESGTIAPFLESGLELLERLGNPPIWAVHLWWSGVQEGIVRNAPDALAPYAKRLVRALPHSSLASTMAAAGTVWVAVLAGRVDPDAVEETARSLASAGLAWDGARLAGHAASRTEDRKVATRLLSVARDLHPKDSKESEGEEAPRVVAGNGETQLSEREFDVARLVLRGKTYVEIGESLFISPRTVEHHVAHMRRRLSATSRSDLLSKLRMTISPSEESESPSTRNHGGESLRRPVRT
nr:LuxR family transcriptional regulator [Actinomycetales bacterium]